MRKISANDRDEWKKMSLHLMEKTERAKASHKPLNLARFRAFFVYKNFTYFYKKYLDKL